MGKRKLGHWSKSKCSGRWVCIANLLCGYSFTVVHQSCRSSGKLWDFAVSFTSCGPIAAFNSDKNVFMKKVMYVVFVSE
jgi:hypothetical protein